MKSATTPEPMIHLVSCQHGIYNWYVLFNNHLANLYIDHIPLAAYLAKQEETIKSVHPDTPDYLDQIEWLESHGLRIKNDVDGLLYTIWECEGDLWAIHPAAEWDEAEETYKFPEPLSAPTPASAHLPAHLYVHIRNARPDVVIVNDALYNNALNVLPPITFNTSPFMFAMGEAYDHQPDGTPIYYCFMQRNKTCWGTLDTIEGARESFSKVIPF